MQLPEAIKYIVEKFGVKSLCDVKTINILNDLNAFYDLQQSRFILKCILNEGILERIIPINEKDSAVDMIISKFVQNTGFIPNIANYTFDCIFYGLGWVTIIPEIALDNNQTTELTANTSPKKRKTKITHKPVEKMDDDEFEEYIWSKIEWDHDLEKEAGLTFSNYQITSFNFYTGFRILFEVKGKLETDHLSLKYTAYDINGRLRANGTGFFETKGSTLDKVNDLNVHFNKPLDILDKVIISATYNY